MTCPKDPPSVRALACSDALETLRARFFEVMRGTSGWSWEYRSPRDPILPFSVQVVGYGEANGRLVRDLVELEVPSDLFTIQAMGGGHWKGYGSQLLPILVP